jgi:hypothetical protein
MIYDIAFKSSSRQQQGADAGVLLLRREVQRGDNEDGRMKMTSYQSIMKTAVANTVVQRPSLLPSADWQIFLVLNMWPLAV